MIIVYDVVKISFFFSTVYKHALKQYFGKVSFLLILFVYNFVMDHYNADFCCSSSSSLKHVMSVFAAPLPGVLLASYCCSKTATK